MEGDQRRAKGEAKLASPLDPNLGPHPFPLALSCDTPATPSRPRWPRCARWRRPRWSCPRPSKTGARSPAAAPPSQRPTPGARVRTRLCLRPSPAPAAPHGSRRGARALGPAPAPAPRARDPCASARTHAGYLRGERAMRVPSWPSALAGQTGRNCATVVFAHLPPGSPRPTCSCGAHPLSTPAPPLRQQPAPM